MENRGPSINDVAQGMIESIIELKRELVSRSKIIEQLKSRINELEQKTQEADNDGADK